MKRSYLLAGAAVLAFLGLWYLSRGGVPQEEQVACDAPGWISQQPDRELLDGVRHITRDNYLMLRGKLLGQAILSLKTDSFHRLTEEEMAAARIAPREAGWPYFMRALTFNPEKNEINIGSNGRDYFVTHYNQGAKGVSMKCWPVLIFLKEPPERVFVRAEAEE